MQNEECLSALQQDNCLFYQEQTNNEQDEIKNNKNLKYK